MICSNCGKEAGVNNRFCPFCGTSLGMQNQPMMNNQMQNQQRPMNNQQMNNQQMYNQTQNQQRPMNNQQQMGMGGGQQMQQGFGVQNMGTFNGATREYNPNAKSLLVTFLLVYLFGMIGAHYFYLGMTGKGVVRIVLCILSFLVIPLFINIIFCIIDIFKVLSGNMKDVNGESLRPPLLYVKVSK